MSTGNNPYNIDTPSSSADEDGISIQEYLLILIDEWPSILIPMVLVILVTGGYLLLAVPTYISEGVVQVSTSDSAGTEALLELSGIGQPSPVETEVEILRSNYILNKAAQNLTLNISQPIPRVTLDMSVSLDGQSPIGKDLKSLRKSLSDFQVEDWIERPLGAEFLIDKKGTLHVFFEDNKVGTASPGESFEAKGIHFTYKGNGDLEKNKRIAVTIIPDDQLASTLRDKLGVSSIGGRKATNLVRLSCTHQDRMLARDFINEVMKEYMRFALRWKSQRADKSSKFIEIQLNATREHLEASEGELQTFLEESGAVMLPDQAKELITGGAELELELRKVHIQEELLNMVAGQISRANKKGTPVSLTGDFLFDDELMGHAIGSLNNLQMKKETLLSDLKPGHPDVLKIKDEIRRVRIQILDYVKASRNRIAERQRSLGRALEQIQEKLASFPDKERRMASLRRKQEVGQELFTFLMTKLEESRILRASTTTDKRIIDSATTPFRKASPKRLNLLVVASILGLLVGVGFVILRRAIDPRVQDEEEAKSLTNLPVHGVIPNLQILGMAKEGIPAVEQVWSAPKGPAAESFRTLRTNLEFSQTSEKPIKVIQITSSEASEGKSTVISNLAVALSKAGHSVVIADLDLRRPTQHRVWGIPRSPGISDYLVGKNELRVHSLAKWEVTIAPAGHEPPESQRLLSSENLSTQINAWKTEFDFVLLDTPPLLVSDSLVISKLSDLMLFVVRPKSCKRASLKLARQTYNKMNVLKGLVINGVTTRRGGYYHYYRGSYYGSRTTDTQES